MKPSAEYIATSALLGFVMAALIGYPSAAINSPPGVAPRPGLWLVITFALGTVLTIYSSLPKPPSLLRVNWIVLPTIACTVYLSFMAINPDGVKENTFWLFVFSVFTVGGPFWLVFWAIRAHRKYCLEQIVSDTILPE
jgi:hypothetical protein